MPSGYAQGNAAIELLEPDPERGREHRARDLVLPSLLPIQERARPPDVEIECLPGRVGIVGEVILGKVDPRKKDVVALLERHLRVPILVQALLQGLHDRLRAASIRRVGSPRPRHLQVRAHVFELLE
jgi:hypothetical protein